MISIPSFHIIEKVHSGAHASIYRALREADKLPVIIKLLDKEHPTSEERSLFRREYEMTGKMNGDGAIKIYDLQKCKNTLMMVEEDFGGESLATLVPAVRPVIEARLTLAIKITECLGSIHQQRIIHKDLSPANILWNPRSGQVKIIDFGIATEFSCVTTAILHPVALEGTLAYISPEQTGRMNRALDYRTDMYSLGATLYELFTGEPPFKSRDPLELVHCHIARTPALPHELNPQITPVLSGIIMKLMAKMAEERYQSAYGLRADLERCLDYARAGGAEEIFDLGLEDFSETFHIPQKLYGRDMEVVGLLEAFERASSGRAEILLVTGYAGIGKTAVVHEIQRSVVEKQGYFIEGKLDQLNLHIPYASLTEAFRKLIHQLLSEDDVSLAQWKENILLALGPNGKVVTDVIPEMELIIGAQPDIPVLAPAETQNRFRFVFQNFVRAFSTPSHPLVLFLDDLQWADQASLQLIEFIMNDPSAGFLLLIGAYRDNEVEEGHPLMLTLESLRKTGTRVNKIILSPLSINHISQLITESLHCTENDAMELTGLCYGKTRGNPFFLNQFLQTLYREGLIEFDGEHRRWRWDMGKLREQEVTENVVEFMVGKIRKLPSATQHIMEYASCIGNQFDLPTLSIISGEPYPETAGRLLPALEAGLVVPAGEAYKSIQAGESNDGTTIAPEYRFLHDRVQQAAYSLIDDLRKEVLHLKAGRSMLAHTPPEALEGRVFEIVHHFNLSRGIIKDAEERQRLAEVNLLAGRRAKASAAYEPAYRYLSIGISCLEKECWDTQYSLALALFCEAAEAAYLKTDFTEMERLAEVVIAHARTVLDKVSIYESQMRAAIAQHRPLQAIQTGLHILGLLGVRFPARPGKLRILLEILNTKRVLAGKRPEDLLTLPGMTDPGYLAMSRIISIMRFSAYLAMPTLAPLLILKSIRLSFRHGNTSLASSAYAAYGLILCGVMDDIKNGYRFGLLGLSLMENLNAGECKARTMFTFNTFIKHWKDHIRTTLSPLLDGYKAGLETGDIESAGFSAMTYCYHSFYAGVPLAKLETEMARFSEAVDRLKQLSSMRFIRSYQQMVRNLVEHQEDPTRLDGEYYNEDEMLPLHMEAGDRTSIFNVRICKIILGFLFGEYAGAYEEDRKAWVYLDGGRAAFANTAFFFYDSLIRLAMVPTFTKKERKQSLKQVAKNRKRLKKWAQHAPTNNRHKWLLVEAELARVEGRDLDTIMKFFREAIRLAGENEFLQEEALANELAARFWMGRGDDEIAGLYMREAHYCYGNWGAKAKVRHLERTYPQFLAEAAKKAPGEKREKQRVGVSVPSSDEWSGGALDLGSVIKTSQAISGEVDLDALLKKVMRILIESAGAQEGCLIMKKDGELLVRVHITMGMDSATLLENLPIEGCDLLSQAIVQYVARTQEAVVLSNAAVEGIFCRDPYIVRKKPLSILCMPVMQHGVIVGVLYLENNQITDAFTQDRMEVLRILSSQAAISIQNALLYAERKQAEEELRQAEAKYRNIFDNSAEGIYQSTPDGRVLTVNPAAARIFGYDSPEDGIASINNIAKDIYVDPVRRDEFQSLMQAQGYVKDFELRAYKKDRSMIDISINCHVVRDKSGHILYFEGAVEDITEKKRIEEALKESRQQTMDIINFLPDATLAIDTSGKVIIWNRAIEEMTGVKSADMIGQGNYEYAIPFYGQRRPILIDLVFFPDEITEKKYNFVQKEKDLLHAETNELVLRGERRYLFCTAAPLYNIKGEIMGAIESIRDITARKQGEEELKKYKEHLESQVEERTIELQHAKEAAEAATKSKSEFLANMSHEIRTPMNGIIGMTGLLLDTGLSEEQRNYAEMLRTSGELLLGVIDDILDFSKIEAGKLEIETIEFDLMSTLEETAKFLALRAREKGLELVCRIDPGVHTFLIGDPGRLRQILVNLIGNAIKFTPAGEVVVEAATEYETDGQVAVRFNIRDTGIGIAKDKISPLFNSFQQVDASTSRKFGGSGLGLAISRRLVELMNGRIGVESIEGQGSNFWFTAVFDKGSPRGRSKMSPFADISGVRVLAVDDNAVNRIVIAEQMRAWGVRHAEAEDGVKAMEMLHAAHAENDPFRIVITDMHMPGMDGEALAKGIKADPALRDTLLIMLASNGVRGDSKRLASLGFAAYFTKPVRMVQLHDCIATILSGSSLHEKAWGEPTIITSHRLREIVRRNARILLVEDNKVNKMVAVGILGKLGFSAETADNGRQAIEMLEAASYDIVFMDVQMPVMDGYQATMAIRGGKTKAADPKVPIIAMTAHAMKGDREKCLQWGMDDYISKPISPRKLAKVLEKWLPKAQVELPPATDMASGKTAAEEALPVFDFPGLKKRTMDDMDLTRTIVAAFMEEIPRMLDGLREQIERGDVELAGRQAHTIKGAAANTGFMAMSAIAADMQKAGETGEMETIIALLPELEGQLDLLRAKIKEAGIIED